MCQNKKHKNKILNNSQAREKKTGHENNEVYCNYRESS
jgi:hypothetical protein